MIVNKTTNIKIFTMNSNFITVIRKVSIIIMLPNWFYEFLSGKENERKRREEGKEVWVSPRELQVSHPW